MPTAPPHSRQADASPPPPAANGRGRLTNAPVVIGLPDGLSVSGVTVWAVRLAGALAAAGRAVALVLHDEPEGQARLEIPLHPGVETIRLAGCPPLRSAAGDLSAFIGAYRDVVRAFADRRSGPVVLCPTLLGDAFGIAAALCVSEPETVRLVGWQHADIAYDTQVLAHYEPVIAKFVGVSARVTNSLRARLAHRARDIVQIANGVPVSDRAPVRERHGLVKHQPVAPLRLIYAGRMEHNQKRVTALLLLSDELARRGIEHTMTLVGDGPATAAIDAMIADGPVARVGAAPTRATRVRRLGPCGPEAVGSLLDEADAFVLASRYEGLSVAMLEAMGRGCVPVVTRVASGAEEAVRDGENGFFAEARADADDAAVASSLADAVERMAHSDVAQVSRAAWETVRERFGLERHAAAVGALLDEAAASPARAWPARRACAFTAPTGAAPVGGTGTVPADGAQRMRSVLRTLAGRTIVLHGAGRHTVELADVLAESPARIVAICDDDRGRWGRALLGWPVISPAEAGRTGATDAVISSWLHEAAVWARRGVYEGQGMRVHRVYQHQLA